MNVATITAVSADIMTIAIVNAANNAMRAGGGGVNSAIHRAGGPAILADCIKRSPDGLRAGDAGWTTAGDLPARWVIHTVGPNYTAGQHDRALLESCYRRALEVDRLLMTHQAAEHLEIRTTDFKYLITADLAVAHTYLWVEITRYWDVSVPCTGSVTWKRCASTR